MSAKYSDWQHSKGRQNLVGLIAGKEWESGNFVIGAEYVDQEEAYQRDVPWEFLHNTYYIYPEGCENQVEAPYDGRQKVVATKLALPVFQKVAYRFTARASF